MRSSLFTRLFFSSSSSSSSRTLKSPLTSPPKLKNIPCRYRSATIKEAKLAITEYLHSTRSLPFTLADHIATHSPFSLSSHLSLLSFPPSSTPSHFPRLLRSFLSYSPLNEFDFFFESIGLPPSPHNNIHNDNFHRFNSAPSPGSIFLSDDPLLLSAVSALVHFGFPCSRLGLLSNVFTQNAGDLVKRLHRFEELGFRRVYVIGICLAFPWVLDGSEEGRTGLLFRDLRWLFLEWDLDNDVDGVYGICRKVRVFYDLGAEMGGQMGQLLERNRERVFFDLGEEVLVQKVSFFLKLGMRKEDAGVFVLENGELLDLDLDGPEIVVPECLVGLGLGEEEVAVVEGKYPYVMGKNRLGNLPGILRAADLDKWFVDKIVGGDVRYLRPDFVCAQSRNRMFEDEFLENLKTIRKNVKLPQYVDNKLEFLYSIGFGKNNTTLKFTEMIHGPRDELQERFDCLLEMGIEHKMLCRMINAVPNILNQSNESIRAKLKYLCNYLGYPVGYLNNFPAFLCFDLENRIKPRYNVFSWLDKKGLVKKSFSPATLLANAEKKFIIILYGIHPAAPKQWLEVFSSRSDSHGNLKKLFPPHS